MKKCKWITLLSVTMVLVFAVLALGSTDSTEPEPVDSPDNGAGNGPEEEKVFLIGNSVKMGDLIFTLNSARWCEGDEYFKPNEGERWLVLNCTIENKGDESEIISSLLMFTLYDEESYSRDIELFADTKGSLDGELGAGRTVRGEIAFTVEEGQTQWEFIFEPNVFGFGQAVYKITLNDVE